VATLVWVERLDQGRAEDGTRSALMLVLANSTWSPPDDSVLKTLPCVPHWAGHRVEARLGA
jgi:hypothetical protein